jgi:hypothetical protein
MSFRKAPDKNFPYKIFTKQKRSEGSFMPGLKSGSSVFEDCEY